jgi:hypothetical protein
MLLALLTIALIVALTSGSHVVLMLIGAVLIGYSAALAAVLVHEHKVGRFDVDLHLHPH